jgi:tetratricopeptide (TPR) repeat protein
MKTRLIGFIFGAVSIALLAWGLPRTISAFVMAPSAPVLRKLQNLQVVETEALETLVASQQRGLTWSSRGRTLTDLGLAQLLIADRLGEDAPEKRQRIEEAIAALKSGLALAPANPYAWTRLAYATFQLRGWTPEALSALRLAFATAPYDPRLLLSRLRLSFLAWPHLRREDRELVLQQVRYAWRRDPDELTQLAADFGRINVVRAALLRDPDDLAAFEERLGKLDQS